jgi:hypothetical protein
VPQPAALPQNVLFTREKPKEAGGHFNESDALSEIWEYQKRKSQTSKSI